MKMQNYGKLIASIGMLMVLYSEFMPVSIGSSGVINIHLMSKQQNMLMFGELLIVVGVILYAVSKITNGNIKKEVDNESKWFDDSVNEVTAAEDRACPYCAESIKAQAVLCRYCGSSVEPVNPKENVETNREYSATTKSYDKHDFNLIYQLKNHAGNAIMNVSKYNVTIEPSGMLGHLKKLMIGIKIIPFSSIAEISFKEAGLVFPGNLKIIQINNENGDAFLGFRRVEIFFFRGQKNNELAKKIKEYIEARILPR